MDITLLQFVGSIGGIGAVFALIMFWAYRDTVKQLREDRKFMEDRLTGLLTEYNKVCRDANDNTMEHTKVMSELVTWLKAKYGVNQ